MRERPFGPYRLVQQIAVGGMAEIYLARARGLAGFEKYVALKMIHPNFSQDEQFIEMLIDEAKLTVQLQHVNIVQTFDLGRVGENYYITMEYVDGADLYQLLRRGSEKGIEVPVPVAAHIAKEIATGLDYAHRKRDRTGNHLGIVHRDVSPQNVLISHSGEVKLVDFGIAKASMRAKETQVGVIKGKYYYMSPEQAWGDRVDLRTDIFSTGIVLHELLVGQMLYYEEDLHRLLERVRKAEVPTPSATRADVPPELDRIAMRALCKRPEERFQSSGEMASELERFLNTNSRAFSTDMVIGWVRNVLGTTRGIGKVTSPASPEIAAEQVAHDPSDVRDENSVIFEAADFRLRVGRAREGGRHPHELTVPSSDLSPPVSLHLAPPQQPLQRREEKQNPERETREAGENTRLLASEDSTFGEDETLITESPTFLVEEDDDSEDEDSGEGVVLETYDGPTAIVAPADLVSEHGGRDREDLRATRNERAGVPLPGTATSPPPTPRTVSRTEISQRSSPASGNGPQRAAPGSPGPNLGRTPGPASAPIPAVRRSTANLPIIKPIKPIKPIARSAQSSAQPAARPAALGSPNALPASPPVPSPSSRQRSGPLTPPPLGRTTGLKSISSGEEDAPTTERPRPDPALPPPSYNPAAGLADPEQALAPAEARSESVVASASSLQPGSAPPAAPSSSAVATTDAAGKDFPLAPSSGSGPLTAIPHTAAPPHSIPPAVSVPVGPPPNAPPFETAPPIPHGPTPGPNHPHLAQAEAAMFAAPQSPASTSTPPIPDFSSHYTPSPTSTPGTMTPPMSYPASGTAPGPHASGLGNAPHVYVQHPPPAPDYPLTPEYDLRGGSRRKWVFLTVLVAGLAAAAFVLTRMASGEDATSGGARMAIATTPAGAHVAVNEVALTEPTPVIYESVRPGETYELKISLRGYKPEVRKEVMPPAGGLYNVLVPLERIRVSLRVETDPPGASVYLNGNPRGSAPLTLEELDPDEAVKIEIRKKGFTPVLQDLTWGEEERTKELRFTLGKGKK
jgi:serine/threonine protein kinase